MILVLFGDPQVFQVSWGFDPRPRTVFLRPWYDLKTHALAFHVLESPEPYGFRLDDFSNPF